MSEQQPALFEEGLPEDDPALAYARSVAASLPKTNRQHAEAELEDIRRQRRERARQAVEEMTPKPDRQPLAGGTRCRTCGGAHGPGGPCPGLQSITTITDFRLAVSTQAKTLGDVAEVLKGLQDAGVTQTQLMFVLEKIRATVVPPWEGTPIRQ